MRSGNLLLRKNVNLGLFNHYYHSELVHSQMATCFLFLPFFYLFIYIFFIIPNIRHGVSQHLREKKIWWRLLDPGAQHISGSPWLCWPGRSAPRAASVATRSRLSPGATARS